MFDIGFAELVIIAVVGLLVIGPERLPGAIRTGAAWWSRFRRGFNQIKSEVERELHNDEIMRELKKTRQELDEQVHKLEKDFQDTADKISDEDKPEQRPQ